MDEVPTRTSRPMYQAMEHERNQLSLDMYLQASTCGLQHPHMRRLLQRAYTQQRACSRPPTGPEYFGTGADLSAASKKPKSSQRRRTDGGQRTSLQAQSHCTHDAGS
eukprot:3293497-Pleurochrysis_carterae.AAC.6